MPDAVPADDGNPRRTRARRRRRLLAMPTRWPLGRSGVRQDEDRREAAPVRALPADAHGVDIGRSEATNTNALAVPSGESRLADTRKLRRCQISHDIRHELGTIMMLASVLDGAADVGSESRENVRLILGETRWLDQLQRAYEDVARDIESPLLAVPSEPIRLDLVAGEVVAAMKISTTTRIGFASVETLAYVDRLAVWRALRNVLDNAVRAAGANGLVEVRVNSRDGWATAQVDDDGPGLASAPAGRASLGLGIVQDLTAAWSGQLEIRTGIGGGCSVQLRMPLALQAGSDG